MQVSCRQVDAMIMDAATFQERLQDHRFKDVASSPSDLLAVTSFCVFFVFVPSMISLFFFIQARKRHININFLSGWSWDDPGFVRGFHRVCPWDKSGENLGQTRIFSLFYTVEARFHRVCPWDKPGLSQGQSRGRRAAQKVYVNKVYVPLSLAIYVRLNISLACGNHPNFEKRRSENLGWNFGVQPIPRVAPRVAPRIGFSHRLGRECHSESCSENTPEFRELLREWPFHSESVFFSKLGWFPDFGVLIQNKCGYVTQNIFLLLCVWKADPRRGSETSFHLDNQVPLHITHDMFQCTSSQLLSQTWGGSAETTNLPTVW